MHMSSFYITHNQTHPVRLMCTSDQPVAEATTYITHNKHERRPSMSTAWSKPAIPELERPQTYALGYGYTGAGKDTTRQSGQTPDKEVEIKSITVYVSVYSETEYDWNIISPGSSVVADIKSNVLDFYFLFWSLSRLLCYVVSISSVAIALGSMAAENDNDFLASLNL